MRTVGAGWKAALRGLARLQPWRSLGVERPCDEKLRILALVPEGPDQFVLQAASENAGWGLTLSNSAADYGSLWPGSVPSIVIYDRELSPQHWRETVHTFAKKSPRPYIILLSANADSNLWDELQRAGGSEILRSPIDQDHLLSTLVQGWQLWRSQQRVRPALTALTR